MGLFRQKPKGNWYAEYTDVSGNRVRKSTGTANKQAAQKILDQLKLDASNQRFGLVASPITLETLINEYIANIGDTQHSSDTETRIRRVVDACGWTKPGQITQYQVETAVKSFQNEKLGKPLAKRTQAHHITAMKMFTKWLTQVRSQLHRDPLAGLKKPNWEDDRQRVRRFLNQEEWKWLALTPNAVLYETAIQTGYRASELIKLIPSNLKDDRLVLSAQHTKNKKNANQYITPKLREKLRKALPFEVPHNDRLAELLRQDLAIARWYAGNSLSNVDPDFLQPMNAEGQTLDFHSLRHTCGAWLAIKGVSPKIIQSVMRHSTITLTLDTYGHLMPGAEQDAVLSTFEDL